jgi:tetratricopeptide (TPR) repeat protein
MGCDGAAAGAPMLPARPVVAGALMALALALVPARARAEAPAPPEPGSRFPLDPSNPEASVPSAAQRDSNPVEFAYFLTDLVGRAEEATKRGWKKDAVAYYRALAKALPDRALPMARLCRAYQQLGDRDKALASCRAALGLLGTTVEDHVRLADLVLAGPSPLPERDLADLRASIAHLRTESSTHVTGDQLDCRLALRLGDTAGLERCTGELAVRAPNDAATISFIWALAIRKGNTAEAESLVARARAAGIKPEGLETMESATRWRWVGLRAPWALGIAALALGTAVGLLVFRRKRLRAAGTI